MKLDRCVSCLSRYHATSQLTTKSDVYSFGVVLLEIVTGQPVILHSREQPYIVQWVRQRLVCGNIEGVVDTSLHDDYDVNSVWKVADTALKCTAQMPEQRPTMTDVVTVLQECLQLEAACEDTNVGFYTAGSRPNLSGYAGYGTDMSTDVNQSSAAFELERLGRVPVVSTGPAVR